MIFSAYDNNFRKSFMIFVCELTFIKIPVIIIKTEILKTGVLNDD